MSLARQATVHLHNWSGDVSPEGRLVLRVWNGETREMDTLRSTRARIPVTWGTTEAVIVQTEDLPSSRAILTLEVEEDRQPQTYQVPITPGRVTHVYFVAQLATPTPCQGCTGTTDPGLYIVQGGYASPVADHDWPTNSLQVPVARPSYYTIVPGPWPNTPPLGWDWWTILTYVAVALLILLLGIIFGAGGLAIYRDWDGGEEGRTARTLG